MNQVLTMSLLVVTALGPRGSDRPPARRCAAPCVERVELVATDAALGSDAAGGAGNGWGGHQSRIVRSGSGGVFVVYLVPGQAPNRAEWRVAKRTNLGWRNVGNGIAGREPAHLLLAPTGDLLVVAWPEGVPVLWTGKVGADSVRWTSAAIPGGWLKSEWPYGAAAIGRDGAVCVLQSIDASRVRPAAMAVACRSPGRAWRFTRYPLPHRYAYSFLFPQGDGLEWVAMRDVRWSELGYDPPPKSFGWVFNAIRAWRVDSLGKPPTWERLVREEPPTARGQGVWVYLKDAMRDSRGRLHVSYDVAGPRTAGGKFEMRHAIVDSGRVSRDEPYGRLPSGTRTGFHRIIGGPRGELYWIFGIGKEAYISAAGSGDSPEGPPHPLDLGGYAIDYSGITVASPRGGTVAGPVVDLVFPSGRMVVYARIRLAAGD